MTTRQKQLVRESFPAIREVAGPLSQLFYGRLFELQPSLRPMFRQDLAGQGLKLMEMLSAVVEHVDRLESLEPVLHDLGKRHAGYGVLPHHYAMVEQALLWSFGHAMEYEFDDELKCAWRVVIARVSAAMLAGARG
jgi:hemoglobin-like flavoprotein